MEGCCYARPNRERVLMDLTDTISLSGDGFRMTQAVRILTTICQLEDE